LQLIRDFVNYSSIDRNIKVRLRNFKKAYKMEDAVRVHSENDAALKHEPVFISQNN